MLAALTGWVVKASFVAARAVIVKLWLTVDVRAPSVAVNV
jgi:hypothetical protein